jgi:hypothetical protein
MNESRLIILQVCCIRPNSLCQYVGACYSFPLLLQRGRGTIFATSRDSFHTILSFSPSLSFHAWEDPLFSSLRNELPSIFTYLGLLNPFPRKFRLTSRVPDSSPTQYRYTSLIQRTFHPSYGPCALRSFPTTLWRLLEPFLLLWSGWAYGGGAPRRSWSLSLFRSSLYTLGSQLGPLMGQRTCLERGE